MLEQVKKLEKQLKGLQQSQAADTAKALLPKAESTGDISFISANLGAVDGDFAQAVADSLKGQFEGIVVLGATGNSSVALVATVPEVLTDKAQMLMESWRARSRRRVGWRIILPFATLAIDDAERVAEALRARGGT